MLIKGGRSRDRTLTGRLSLAADFFHLNLSGSGSTSGRNSTDSSKMTWNPFRTKSRERGNNNHRHSNVIDPSRPAMTLKTATDEVICKNIVMR